MRYVIVLFLAAVLAGCASRAPILPAVLNSADVPADVELTDVPFFPQEDYQCGPAALATALRYAGVEVTPEDLAPRVYLPAKEGSLQIEMAAAVRRYDRVPYLLQPGFAALAAELQAGRPVVVFQNLGFKRIPIWHYAVVIGYEQADDVVLLRSGRTERRRMGAYSFLRTWQLGGQWALVGLRPGELPATDDPQGFLRALAAKEGVSGAAAALPSYRAAVERWPANPTARFGLANALRATGQTEAAIEQYGELLAREPEHVAALNNLADALATKGCFKQGLQAIERALSLAPPDHALRPVLEQTRQEIAKAGASQVEGKACAEVAAVTEPASSPLR